jgi:hypothetical protein
MYQETLLFFRPNAYMPADVVAHAEWNIPLMPCGSGYKKGWVILKTPIKPVSAARCAWRVAVRLTVAARADDPR